MLDQLIEGHQWVKTNLNVIPKSGWSIDPFGHGSTVPYLLASSGFEGTIIQRIHYNWKQVKEEIPHLISLLITFIAHSGSVKIKRAISCGSLNGILRKASTILSLHTTCPLISTR